MPCATTVYAECRPATPTVEWRQRVRIWGFLMAKAAAANGRNKLKGWYDIAYVLLHNDDGPTAGADAVTVAFWSVAVAAKTCLLELHANFSGVQACPGGS